jgi:hypothetical protein
VAGGGEVKTTLELGQLVATAGVDGWASDSIRVRFAGLSGCIARHKSGDWGNVCEEDKKSNDWSAENGERVLSEYEIDGRRIWIITERDRSVTTVLFPEEY